MSLESSALIVAIIIIRALSLNKLPKKTFLALWGVALFRLLVPFSVPSSFSIYSIVRALSGYLHQLLFASAPTGTTDTLNVLYVTKPQTSVHASETLTLFWVIGLCVLAMFFSAAYFKSRIDFSSSRELASPFIDSWLTSHSSYRGISIRQHDKIGAPLTYGILKPVILLPKSTDFSDEEKLRYIFTHEYVHIRRLDVLWKALLTIALSLHWFNPLVWVMYILANRDIELSCDETVVRIFGSGTRAAYAMMLINMEEKKGAFTPLCSNFSKNAIEERITSIMIAKRNTLLSIVLSALLIMGIVALFATTASAETPKDAVASSGVTQGTKGQDEIAGSASSITISSVDGTVVGKPESIKIGDLSTIAFPTSSEIGYKAIVVLKSGKVIEVGTFKTTDECTDAIKAYLDEHVKNGTLTQQEADEATSVIACNIEIKDTDGKATTGTVAVTAASKN